MQQTSAPAKQDIINGWQWCNIANQFPNYKNNFKCLAKPSSFLGLDSLFKEEIKDFYLYSFGERRGGGWFLDTRLVSSTDQDKVGGAW